MTVYTDYVGAAKKQNEAQEEIAKQQKEQAKQNTAVKNQTVIANGQADISELGGKYRSIYDENAVRQYIGERRVAENMANLGITDSGLNRTQQTALQVSRGNADYSTRLQYEAAVRSIEQSVQDEISANNLALTNQIATIDQQLANDNAQRLYDAEIKQIEYDAKQQEEAEKAAKEAEEKAEKEEKERQEAAEKAEKEAKEEEQAAKEEHDNFINNLATALKNSLQSGVTETEMAEVLKDFIIRYDLSQADAELILTYAGSTPQRLAQDYFEKAIKERDRWQTLKAGVIRYNNAVSSGKSYDVVTVFKKALSDYNVEQYGADKLLPLLMQEGYITQKDIEKIKYFYTSYIGDDPAFKTKTYGKDKILRFAEALYTQGMVSQLASEFMVALFDYHNN